VRSTPPMTASVSKYRTWDVVVVPFPNSDQTQATVRPGVIVSAPRLHRLTRQYFIAMVTNAKRSTWDGDVAVSNLKGAGLPVPSVVRPAKLATFDESTSRRSCGQWARCRPRIALKY
jgi:mRNA interferase MazF